MTVSMKKLVNMSNIIVKWLLIIFNMQINEHLNQHDVEFMVYSTLDRQETSLQLLQ